MLQFLTWSPWRALNVSWTDPLLTSPGLYRVRRVRRDDLDYIGQTSLPLRQRLRMLRGLYAVEMPYRDPHTVAPALWAQRQIGGEEYEASVCPLDVDGRRRKGLECVAIALYRQEHRRSPTFNFGRMPPGYRMSSGNNNKLVSSGRRFRGGPADAEDASHLPSICPTAPLDQDGCGERWCGYHWSPWQPQTEPMHAPQQPGLYRIRGRDNRIVYIGQGLVRSRLVAHWQSANAAMNPHGQALAAAQPLTCSWVTNADWRNHQRLELENDLIAAWVLTHGTAPSAQFFGQGRGGRTA
jgi:hypothetical protein